MFRLLKFKYFKSPHLQCQLRGYQNFVMNDSLAQMEIECDRVCPVPRFPPRKVAVIGAGSDVGRIASLFLKQQRVIKTLALYDDHPCRGVLGVANDLAHIDTSTAVRAYQGRMFLKDALHDADVVLICGGAYLIPGYCCTWDRNLFFQNMKFVRTVTLGCAEFAPDAIIALQTPPVDCNFALVKHTLKIAGLYDKRKLLGINSVNAMRAGQLYSWSVGAASGSSTIPVICGTGKCTRVPVFSGLAQKACDWNSAKAEGLTRLLRDMDELICRVKSNYEQGHLSIGFSTARFVTNLMNGLFEGGASIDSALVEQADPSKCFGMKTFATPVKVGKGGITDYLIPQTDDYEKSLVEQSRCDLEDMLNLGRCFAVGEDYYVKDCKFIECVRRPPCLTVEPC